MAWLPPGYVPYQVVFARWSFSYPFADFSAATVSMTSQGRSVPVAVEPFFAGTVDTLVWIPDGMRSDQSWPYPWTDTTYVVTISGVRICGQQRSFNYNATVFDPERP